MIENAIKDTTLEKESEKKIFNEYLKSEGVNNDDQYAEYLNEWHLSDEICKNLALRPYKIIKYREERWGPVAQSIYLRKKEQFDMATYYRLEANNQNIMQEVYFRLKDGEESWDQIAQQYHGANPNTTALRGPIPVGSIERPILEALRSSGAGKVQKPIPIGGRSVIVSLKEFKSSTYDNEIREEILRQEFDSWVQTETKKCLLNSSFQHEKPTHAVKTCTF